MKNPFEVTVTISHVSENILAAMKTPWAWLTGLLLYFEPIRDVYVLMVIVVIADFITGMAASYKRRIPRSSSRLKNSVIKCFCYFGAVFIFWQFEERLGIQEIICSYKFIGGFIALVEIISILENMAVITGNPIFLKIVRIIRGKARDKHSDLIGDILDEKNGEYIDNGQKRQEQEPNS